MKLVTVEEMRQIEREADAAGLTYDQMMENAGNGLAEAVLAAYGQVRPRRALGLVGPGNNGGDTLVALAALARQGWQADAYLVRPRAQDDPLVRRLAEAGGEIFRAADDPDCQGLPEMVQESLVLLDGVLGTGARLPLKGETAQALAAARRAVLQAGRPPHVVAVDCPSGVDCESGQAADECIPAELTVTMAAVKAGLLRFPAYSLVGDLQVVGIGPLEGLPAWEAVRRLVVDFDFVRQNLPERLPEAHKGTFGTALIVAGSVNYTGAALLAGKAAYRAGAGLVTLAVPTPLHAALAGQFAEATWILLPDELGVIAAEAAGVLRQNLGRATALLVGPGFGLEETTRDFLDRLLEPGARPTGRGIGFAPPARRAPEETAPLPPLIFDADGLKLLSRLPDWPHRLTPSSVLTPHPGEMAILTGLPVSEIQASRLETAERFARDWGHVVVLKGALTVIAGPDGRSGVIPVATPALARAGTGDVLAGLIAGLRAQGLGAFEAACCGAWIHAQAGLEAAQALGSTAVVLAGDVLQAVIPVMRQLSGI